ncbi:hypothetical protein NHX12_003602 [Muraenolepis orangiensis]|uniref:Solute carrier family 23 member 2 n=1 Tax=Muraenolepis orangiensis TaxID=630683 RepID=A0A9Q0DYP0_9TELE|nr:hypothetical protein NHX12_003602 [Muraenolepis orangiensis]
MHLSTEEIGLKDQGTDNLAFAVSTDLPDVFRCFKGLLSHFISSLAFCCKPDSLFLKGRRAEDLLQVDTAGPGRDGAPRGVEEGGGGGQEEEEEDKGLDLVYSLNDRPPWLPILQGGTFSLITPTLAILALPKWQCPAPGNSSSMDSANGTTGDPEEVWMSRMREDGGKVNVPMIAYKDRKWIVFQYPLFKLFSALFGMCGGWLVCFLLTVFEVLPSKSDQYGFAARTDINLDSVISAPWFHVPYPGQWGLPTISVSSVLGMTAGVLASTMESIGDYYACARLSGAPPPPTHAINRGIAVEGLGCVLAALWGTGNGTTSYSQNIAALGITKYVDLNSSRNLLILGFSTFSGLVLPTWFNSNPGVIDTGTEKERGIKSWRKKVQEAGQGHVVDLSCYDIPFCNNLFQHFKCFQYLPFLPSFRDPKRKTLK